MMDNGPNDLQKTNAHIESLNLETKFEHGWANPPTVRDLRQELEDAIPTHSVYVSRIDNWVENLHKKKVTSPKNSNKKAKIKSEFQPRLIRKQAEWRYPSLSEPFLNTPDMFSVEPRTHEDVERSRQAAAVLNYQFNNEMNKVEFIDELVRAVVDEGTAIVRTGWNYKTRTEMVEVPVVELVPSQDPEYIARMQQMVQVYQTNPEQLAQSVDADTTEAIEASLQDGIPYQWIDTGETEKEERTVVETDAPDLEVCDYRSVILDPTCKGNIDKANFVIYKFETSKAELLAEGLYSHLDLINLDDASILKETDDIIDDTNIFTFNFKDNARKRIVAYEYWGYWDIKGNGSVVPIVATFVNNTMIRLEESPFNHKKLPFDVIKLMPRRKELYGEPDGELIEDNQKVVGAISRGMIDLMAKAANSQTAHAKNFLDPLNRSRFLNQQNYEFNPTAHPEQAIYQHKYPEIPASAYNMVQMHQQDAESFTGVKAFQQGLSGDSLGSSVGGIKSALSAAAKREMSILRRLVEGMVRIGKKIISMNAQFLDSEMVVKLTDEEYVQVNPDDLTGNFDLKLDISTAEADNEKAQELAFMLQTLGNNVPFDMLKMVLVDIARLRKMHTLAKMLEGYQPQPDPYEERMKEVQIALDEAKVMEMQAQAKENLAKAEKALAEAKKAAAEADVVDLDYVEQETGTKHARELETNKAQADGNMELEFVKAALAGDKNSTSNNTQNS